MFTADKRVPSRWSPQGTFFVTAADHNMVIIWGSRYCTDFGQLLRFCHYQVEEFDISPGEKYLVTYSKPKPSDPNVMSLIFSSQNFSVLQNCSNLCRLQGLWLKIFDVKTGTAIVGLNNVDVADSPQWPLIIRWAGGKDDKFFAIISKNKTVAVYETKKFNLLGNAPLLLDDVIDISWSPTQAVLAILLKASDKQPVKVVLLQFPNNVKLAEKDLTAILGDCTMRWQSNGEYLAVNTYGGFEFFRIKEEGIPTDSLRVDKKILAFAWEPSGHRFAVIYGDEPTLSVSFYSMKKTPGKVTELTTLSNRQADALFWSPKGNRIVLAGLKEGNLEFFDVDQLAQISPVANVVANQVAWNQSGKYVATVFTTPQEKFHSDCHSEPDDPRESFTIWSSDGKRLFVHQCQFPITQLDWRPYGGIIDDDMLKKQ
ncbi:eukaryotic translation initiation factor 3 subunit B isoform X1 [Brassica napus]|uniref:eukaryotic translation initiation factor 3 subunit B isoform X1 n=1 Tax=Brassica napus TaxID=3708 RepID=UPI00207A3627|nr:eukaryotic translation initiation factor 3 subunit B isoform X1 [Brassica napus]